MRKTRERRNGATRVEVLVGGFAVVVVALFVTGCPGMAPARQAAKKMECASRMRQLGLAVFQYEKNYACMPNAQWNVWRELSEYTGLRNAARGAAVTATETEVLRCPSDEYLDASPLADTLSYAALVDSAYLDGDNDGTPDGNLTYCGWSYCRTGYGDGGISAESRVWQVHNLTAVAPDTAIIAEYWAPLNRLNLRQETTAGYLRFDWSGNGANATGTIDFTGPAAKETLTKVADVGGYTFLSAFAYEAAQTGKSTTQARMLHGGSINLQYVDGSVLSHRIKDVTDRPAKDIPRWTRAAD